VDVRVLAPQFARLVAEGASPTVLAEGSGYTAEELMSPHGRISWEGFHRVMENTGRRWTDEELRAIGGTVPSAPFLRPFVVVARLLYTVSEVYQWMFGPHGPVGNMFAAEEVSVEPNGMDRLWIVVRMRPGYAPSRTNFIMAGGSLGAISEVLGYAQADVSMELLPDGARYDVRLPAMGGRLAWLRRAATWPFTARAAAEELRLAHEELYQRYLELEIEVEARRVIVAGLPIACVALDAEGRVAFVNAAFEALVGFRAHDVVGLDPVDLFGVDSRAGARDLVGASHSARTGAPSLLAVKTRAGAEVRCVCHYTALADHAVSAVCTFEDVSERLRLEEQLARAQRMEAIGRLAGGVAHDFNNLLAVVLGYSDLMLSKPGADVSREDGLREIQRAAERGKDLTRQLLTFSRTAGSDRQRVDVDAVLRGVEGMLVRLIREDILVTVIRPTVPCVVEVGRGQLEQVIVNLAVNARDAMPGGGRLTIDVSVVSDVLGLSRGEYVRLRVVDTGVGMDEPTRARIFEPFFTTKGAGDGTGLGLAVVYGIVGQHGGVVNVTSAPGEGSTFDVYLPRLSGPPTPFEVEPKPPNGGVEIVLVAEDEAPVREFLRRALTDYGYRVLVATGPDDAVTIARSVAVDLLVTDVVMPGTNGVELARRVRELRPLARVLFVSGYADGLIGPELAGGVHLLAKPFTASALATSVREVLDEPAAEAPR
jgi:two-component system, cell cycle sensor histidine kinase and response regulator CckA